MKNCVISLARAAIMEALGGKSSIDLEAMLRDNPPLRQSGAAFVTLTKEPHEQLRGCIGSLSAYRPLYQDIISNARSAALHDPRFRPLSVDEFKEVKIEVSILSEPKPLEYRDTDDLKAKIRPCVDGIVLEYGNYRATYLPQVWEQLPDFENFFASLCMKAGLAGDCLRLHPNIQKYQVSSHKE